MNISVECALLSGRDRLGKRDYISSRIADTVLFIHIHQLESPYFMLQTIKDLFVRLILADPIPEFRMETLLF